VKHLQGLRYTNFEKLKNATSLDEVFRNSPPDGVLRPMFGITFRILSQT
jgi:hypothetical protein